MRLTTYLKAHGLAVALMLTAAYVVWRMVSGKAIVGPGHSTPADARSWGWAVYQAGITGWEEHGPGGETVMHDTGWDGG